MIKDKIFIEVSGGVITAVRTSLRDAELHIIDWDNDDFETEIENQKLQAESQNYIPLL